MHKSEVAVNRIQTVKHKIASMVSVFHLANNSAFRLFPEQVEAVVITTFIVKVKIVLTTYVPLVKLT